MSIIEEIGEVVREYESRGKGVSKIKVNRALLNGVNNGSGRDVIEYGGENTMFGYPCDYIDDNFLRYTVMTNETNK